MQKTSFRAGAVSCIKDSVSCMCWAERIAWTLYQRWLYCQNGISASCGFTAMPSRLEVYGEAHDRYLSDTDTDIYHRSGDRADKVLFSGR